jgi:hypothetical protein
MMQFTAVRIFEEYDFWVYVPEGFQIEPKPLPEEVAKRSDIHWFGNFQLINKMGETPPRLHFKYEIQAFKEEEMQELVFWDGKSVVTLSEDFHDFREIIPPEGRPILRAKLTMTDPACGWR